MTTPPTVATPTADNTLRSLPPHTAEVHRFVLPPGLARDAAVAWARGVFAFADNFGDAVVIRAAKVLEANDPDHYSLAVEMRRFLEGCAAERAARLGEAFEAVNARRGRAQSRKNLAAVAAGVLLIALVAYLTDGLGARIAATVAEGAEMSCGAC